jgi:hypothetical protein
MKTQGKNTQAVAERILNAFRSPECLPKALAPVFIHRTDDVPCRRWSWHNQLIAALSGTCDARGFKQWNSVGRTVVKGKKAIWILAPCTKKITERKENGENALRTIVYGFRSIPVFALEDTKGDPLPDTGDKYLEWVKQLPLADVAEAWGIQVDSYTHARNAPLGYYQYGSSGNQAIMLGVENLSTWTHEMVHAADHRLTNLAGNKLQKEIVAELGASILLECLGMKHDADLGGAFEYIERYARDEKLPTVRACIQVLDRTCNAVQLIIDEAQRLNPAPATT